MRGRWSGGGFGTDFNVCLQLDPLIIENNGPTSIFITGKDNKKVNISALSVDKDFIIVTTGK